LTALERERRQAWFKHVILPNEPALRHYIAAKFRDAVDVEDVVSESLLRAYSAENFPRIDRGLGYLITIARNIVIDGLRRNRLVTFDSIAHLKVDVADESPSPERVVTGRDQIRHLQGLIERLPNQSRRVLLLRRVHDLSPREIAAEMGLSVSTVEKHLTRALVLLTKFLAEDAAGGMESPIDENWQCKKTL
jgi:RNA polymerase sigma-70 factor (ECF subfamily)